VDGLVRAAREAAFAISGVEDCQHVTFAQDQVVVADALDLDAGVLREQRA